VQKPAATPWSPSTATTTGKLVVHAKMSPLVAPTKVRRERALVVQTSLSRLRRTGWSPLRPCCVLRAQSPECRVLSQRSYDKECQK
jgi:hypothetical protein